MDSKKNTDNILTKQGYKNTRSRKLIIEILEGAENPISAEDIFLNIKESGASINLSTVYRTLEIMESTGLINKAVTTDGKARYELIVDGHRHHLVCTNCSKTIPLDNCPLEKIEKDVQEKTSFDITGHRLELYGICPKCKKK